MLDLSPHIIDEKSLFFLPGFASQNLSEVRGFSDFLVSSLLDGAKGFDYLVVFVPTPLKLVYFGFYRGVISNIV